MQEKENYNKNQPEYVKPQHKQKKLKENKKNKGKEKMSGWKIALIVIASIVFTVCLAADIWYLYILLFAPEKYNSKTFKIDTMTDASGNQKNFIELVYNSNENGNGYEALDVKFNFLIDEEKSSFYSQGIQLVATSQTQKNSLGFKFLGDKSTISDSNYDSGGIYPFLEQYHHGFGTYAPNSNFEQYNYQSIDDYETTSISTNPINLDTSFKLEIGKELYMVKFRGFNDYKDTMVAEEKRQNYLNISHVDTLYENIDYFVIFTIEHFVNWHYQYDVNFLIQLLFNSLEPIKSGGTQTIVFDLPDMFDYYKYDEKTGQYSSERELDTTKIRSEIRNFYSLKVTVSKNGLSKYSDSLFNCVKGSSTFNITGDYVSDEFFAGRSVIRADLEDFVLQETSTPNTFTILLSDEFVSKHNQYKDKIYLSLYLDYKTYFESKNLNVLEPTKDSLRGFAVYKVEINKSYYNEWRWTC